MKPLYDAKCIQIEITNSCNKKCANCTRFVGHHAHTYFMTLKQVENALQSLEGYEGIVGIMGGEPTLHSQFREICKLYQEYIPKEHRGLWTNGANWNKYEDIIRETFNLKSIQYNDHTHEYHGDHQPLLIASKDIVEDEVFRKELIDKCWIQARWSPSINPHGAFFCEVAAALDMLLDLNKGWVIKKGWWNKEVKDFQDQVDIYCQLCSAAIPFNQEVYNSKREFVSPTIHKLLSNKDPFHEYSREYSREDYKENVKNWKPGTFRSFYQCEPNKPLTKEEYDKL